MLKLAELVDSRPKVGGVPINQIWIVRDSGLCLFQSSFDKDKTARIDNKLFPGFISAIASFASEVSKRPMKKLQMGDIILHQYKKEDLLACISTKNEVEDEKSLEDLFEKILNEFNSEFRPILETSEVFDITSFEAFQSKVLQLFKVNLSLTISESVYTPSFNLLYKVLGKELDKIVTTIVKGEKLAVVGDKGQTEIIVATLEQFSPHRKLKVSYWVNDISLENLDLVGIPNSLISYFEKEGYLIVDLERGKIKGTSNRFVSKLVKDIKEVDDSVTRSYLIQTRLSFFISRVGTILDLLTKEEVSRKALDILRKDIDPDLFELIIDYICHTIDPKVKENPMFAKKASTWRKLDNF